MSTGGELQKVEPLNVGNLNAGNVPEGLNGLRAFGSVHDERAFSGNVAAVPHLPLPRADPAAVLRLLRVGKRSDLSEDLDGLLRFLDAFDGVADDERELRDGLDPVAAGQDERRDGGGGDGRDDGEALLVDVDLAVPAAPDLCRGEHAAAAAHVAEGSLTGAVGAAAGDARDTGDGTAGSPGLGGGLVAGAAADGVGLAGVLGDVVVDECDDVWADGGLHDVREGDGWGGVGGHVALEGLDGNERTSCCCCCRHWCGA